MVLHRCASLALHLMCCYWEQRWHGYLARRDAESRQTGPLLAQLWLHATWCSAVPPPTDDYLLLRNRAGIVGNDFNPATSIVQAIEEWSGEGRTKKCTNKGTYVVGNGELERFILYPESFHRRYHVHVLPRWCILVRLQCTLHGLHLGLPLFGQLPCFFKLMGDTV